MQRNGYLVTLEQALQALGFRDELCRAPAGAPIEPARVLFCAWFTVWLSQIVGQPLPPGDDEEEQVTIPGELLPYDSAMLPLEATATEPFGPDLPEIDIIL